MGRWVGLGVIADTLINIGRVLAERALAAGPATGSPAENGRK